MNMPNDHTWKGKVNTAYFSGHGKVGAYCPLSLCRKPVRQYCSRVPEPCILQRNNLIGIVRKRKKRMVRGVPTREKASDRKVEMLKSHNFTDLKNSPSSPSTRMFAL